MLNAILALLLCTALAVTLGVAVMIYGWGLTPQSWWWIIGGGLFGQVFIRFVMSRIELPQRGAK